MGRAEFRRGSLPPPHRPHRRHSELPPTSAGAPQDLLLHGTAVLGTALRVPTRHPAHDARTAPRKHVGRGPTRPTPVRRNRPHGSQAIAVGRPEPSPSAPNAPGTPAE